MKTTTMSSRINWRIYYGDGSTFDSTNGGPASAPCLNVQIIVEPDPKVGRRMLHAHDYYWWGEKWWVGGDLFGLWDHMSQPGAKIVKFGRTLPIVDFDSLYQRAKIDGAFARKSGQLRTERP